MRGSRYSAVLQSLSIFALLSGAAEAQRPILNIDDLVESKLISPDPDSQDAFGSPVAIDGDWMVLGATGDDEQAVGAGAAYVFKRENGVWSFQQKLMAKDGEQGDAFGSDVDIFEEWIVVGAFKDDDNGIDSGSAYAFKRDLTTDVWSQNQKLLAADPGANQGDWFGFSVGLDASIPSEGPQPLVIHTIVVGAPHDESLVNSARAGSIYLFQLSGGTSWTGGNILIAPEAPDSQGLENFGFSVDIRGDGIVVGTPDDFIGAVTPVETGAAYFLSRRTIVGAWGFDWKFLASDGVNGDDFGWSVAMDIDSGNNYMVVVGDKRKQAAYVYRGNTNAWDEEILTPQDLTANPDRYGDTVAIDLPLIIVGAPDSDPGPSQTNAGALYFYQQVGTNEWNELGYRADLTTINATQQMSEWIAISGYTFAASSPTFDIPCGGFNHGQTYVFEDFPIFVDGFESGDVSAWSGSAP